MALWCAKSAFTQARRNKSRFHLKATTFVALNRKEQGFLTVLDVLYGDENSSKAWGFRLLAIDGDKIHLPNTTEIIQETK